MALPEIFRTREAAQKLRVSPDTVRKLVRAGELQAVMVAPRRRGRTHLIFTEDQLAAYLASHATRTKAAAEPSGPMPGWLLKHRARVQAGRERREAKARQAEASATRKEAS